MILPLDQAFRASNAWDARWDLPLCPELDNPWLYMAYADMVMRAGGGPGISPADAEMHFLRCELAVPADRRDPGIFMRWPYGGDQNSHDEILGAAYLSAHVAKRILLALALRDGDFNVTGEPERRPMEFNVSRMIFLMPYLMGAAGLTPNLFHQAVWSASILWGICTRKAGDAGGTLRDGLMTKRMGSYPLCRAAIAVWTYIANRRGFTPKACLAIEPKECPVYALTAPESW